MTHRVFLVLFLTGSISVATFAYNVTALKYEHVKTIENGVADRELLIARSPSGLSGRSGGPDYMTVSENGKLIYVDDQWQRKQKIFDSSFEFRKVLTLPPSIGKFHPCIIEGDIAYGYGTNSMIHLVYAVVDLAKSVVLATFDSGVSMNEFQTANDLWIKRNEGHVDLYLNSDKKTFFTIRYEETTGEFHKSVVVGTSYAQYLENTAGYADPYSAPPGMNEYAKDHNLSVDDVRTYFGEYKGYRIWLGMMKSVDDTSASSRYSGDVVGSLFVLVGKADETGTPLEGYYLPQMRYNAPFRPLLAFNQSGVAYLMYSDDATKQAQVIRFDMNGLIAGLPPPK